MRKDLYLEAKLKVGTKIKIGRESSKHCMLEEGDVIELIEGTFECDNGYYPDTQYCPAIWLVDDFESIYHLFGNDLENFLDSEIIESNHTASAQNREG